MIHNVHTPGPWAADFSSDAVRVRAPDGSRICTLNWLSASGRRDGNEGEANARLIATAPELLTALEGLLSEYTMDDRLAAYAAIAKARAKP